MSEKKEIQPIKSNSKLVTVGFLIVVVIVLGIWAANWILVDKYLCYEQGGQFGDRFGATTSLFGGLTIVGLLYTIYLQREDLKIARETNRLSIEELKTSNLRFDEQNKVLKIQKFETTFFNLLNNLEKTKNTLTGERVFEVYSRFQTSFSNLNSIFLMDLQETFYKKNPQTSTSGIFYSNYEQFIRLFQVTVFLVIDEADSSSQGKYFHIIAALLTNEERMMLWYYSNLRESGRGEKYKLYEKQIFGNLKCFHPSHDQILKS